MRIVNHGLRGAKFVLQRLNLDIDVEEVFEGWIAEEDDVGP